MLHVERAKYIGGYKIEIAFNDGTRNVVDLESVVFSDGRKIVSELRNLNLFKDFSIQWHTLAWKNGLDFAPEFLQSRKVCEERFEHFVTRYEDNVSEKESHPLLQLTGILSHEDAQDIRSEKMNFSGV